MSEDEIVISLIPIKTFTFKFNIELHEPYQIERINARQQSSLSSRW